MLTELLSTGVPVAASLPSIPGIEAMDFACLEADCWAVLWQLGPALIRSQRTSHAEATNETDSMSTINNPANVARTCIALLSILIPSDAMWRQPSFRFFLPPSLSDFNALKISSVTGTLERFTDWTRLKDGAAPARDVIFQFLSDKLFIRKDSLALSSKYLVTEIFQCVVRFRSTLFCAEDEAHGRILTRLHPMLY